MKLKLAVAFETIRRYLKSGVDRVILGSVALKDPKFTKQMLEKFGSRAITIGVDGRNGQVATDGWLNPRLQWLI